MTICSTAKNISTDKPAIFRKKVLDWYDVHRRILPWRALEGEAADPYRIWLSEVMLQQTTVQAVIKYFLKFTDKWPDVHALARADNDDVMSNWAGLGYYARARNLHKCANIISNDYDGVFPSDQVTLQKLPGIGDYTSAAITSIAFNKPANVVDGNVERVMARYHACKIAVPEGKKVLKGYAALYADGFTKRTGDYAQSLMDLGATICTPKSPACSLCPLNENCIGYRQGTPEIYPLRAPKKERPKRYGYIYHVTNVQGDVLIHKRPEKGLLGGMYGFPTSKWLEDEGGLEHLELLGDGERWRENVASITHVFTHFHLTLVLFSCVISDKGNIPLEYEWIDKVELQKLGMPTAFKKALKFFG